MNERDARATLVLARALELGRHWNDQAGANVATIDALADAVRAFDEADVDHNLARACREWHSGRLDRATFLTRVHTLLEGEPRRFQPLPVGVTAALRVLSEWDRGVCPVVTEARHACAWTCTDCGQQRPATLTSQGQVVPEVKCGRWEKGEERRER